MTGTKLTLQGRLASDSVMEWVAHRANLLDLAGWARRESSSVISVVLVGPEALIDAMEVACSLGPGDVLVETITKASYPLNRALSAFEIEE